jgi:flavin reductase (DIM6/NTAB) family NADH-FMN oxidoreductase RutF
MPNEEERSGRGREICLMKEIPANQAYRLLEPGPIVLVTTAQNGKPNVKTMGFHMIVQHDPPLIGSPFQHSETQTDWTKAKKGVPS